MTMSSPRSSARSAFGSTSNPERLGNPAQDHPNPGRAGALQEPAEDAERREVEAGDGAEVQHQTGRWRGTAQGLPELIGQGHDAAKKDIATQAIRPESACTPRPMFPELLPADGSPRPPPPTRHAATPALFSPSEHAERRLWEFFTAHIRNPNTRHAYLAALRMFFDWLVVGQVLPFNPANSVRGPRHVVKTDKTPVLSAKKTRALLDGVDVSNLVGLRDRAFLGVLVYSFARVSTAVSLRVADYYTQGRRWFFRLHEKGGRYNVVPAHHVVQGYVDAYLETARISKDRRGPLFRSAKPGQRDVLEVQGMSRVGAFKMIKRRARQARLLAEICAQSSRGTGITEYLRNGGDIEVAARIAGHESTCTTQLYNRLREEISLDEIERIHI